MKPYAPKEWPAEPGAPKRGGAGSGRAPAVISLCPGCAPETARFLEEKWHELAGRLYLAMRAEMPAAAARQLRWLVRVRKEGSRFTLERDPGEEARLARRLRSSFEVWPGRIIASVEEALAPRAAVFATCFSLLRASDPLVLFGEALAGSVAWLVEGARGPFWQEIATPRYASREEALAARTGLIESLCGEDAFCIHLYSPFAAGLGGLLCTAAKYAAPLSASSSREEPHA